MAEKHRIDAGEKREFQVEVIIANNGEVFGPMILAHEKILVIAEGMVSVERSDNDTEELHAATETLYIPAGVSHRVKAHASPTKLVVICPEVQG